MKRYEMVKRHDDFNLIIGKNNKIKSRYFILFSMEKDEVKPHFGIAVGKKIGNAVIRNKMKRRVRNIIDSNKLLFKKYHNYIIMVKKESVGLPYDLLENDLVSLLRKDH